MKQDFNTNIPFVYAEEIKVDTYLTLMINPIPQSVLPPVPLKGRLRSEFSFFVRSFLIFWVCFFFY